MPPWGMATQNTSKSFIRRIRFMKSFSTFLINRIKSFESFESFESFKSFDRFESSCSIGLEKIVALHRSVTCIVQNEHNTSIGPPPSDQRDTVTFVLFGMFWGSACPGVHAPLRGHLVYCEVFSLPLALMCPYLSTRCECIVEVGPWPLGYCLALAASRRSPCCMSPSNVVGWWWCGCFY